MVRPLSSPVPIRRDGIWYLSRRVPKQFAAVEPRLFVRISTGIAVRDDPRGIKARRIVQQLNDDLEQLWREASSTGSAADKVRFEGAVKRARKMGFPYRTVDELAALPTSELVQHISRLGDPTKQSQQTVATVLGGIRRPGICIFDLPKQIETIDETNFAKNLTGNVGSGACCGILLHRR